MTRPEIEPRPPGPLVNSLPKLLNLTFPKNKTKIKHYIRRKWLTIWDMSPNNKLYEHQPTIKQVIVELLLNICLPAQGRNCTLVHLLQ